MCAHQHLYSSLINTWDPARLVCREKLKCKKAARKEVKKSNPLNTLQLHCAGIEVRCSRGNDSLFFSLTYFPTFLRIRKPVWLITTWPCLLETTVISVVLQQHAQQRVGVMGPIYSPWKKINKMQNELGRRLIQIYNNWKQDAWAMQHPVPAPTCICCGNITSSLRYDRQLWCWCEYTPGCMALNHMCTHFNKRAPSGCWQVFSRGVTVGAGQMWSWRRSYESCQSTE